MLRRPGTEFRRLAVTIFNRPDEAGYKGSDMSGQNDCWSKLTCATLSTLSLLSSSWTISSRLVFLEFSMFISAQAQNSQVQPYILASDQDKSTR